MTIKIDKRAFVFGGTYSNLQATQAMLETAECLGCTSSEIIFTGDMIAYCGQPNETISVLRNSGIHMIKGNCEESIASNAPDCGCGFEEGSACDLLSMQWFNFCQEKIDLDTARWMGKLPEDLLIQIGEFKLRVFHGTPDSINQFVFESDLQTGRYTPPTNDSIDGYIASHSGIPFAKSGNNMIWINSGAAGMPANDGTPRTWYAVIEAEGETLKATIKPLDYDHEAAQSAMHHSGLNNGYAECLKTGFWPSLDVLPTQEKANTGVPLEPIEIEYQKARKVMMV